jgi:hypothetical protein
MGVQGGGGFYCRTCFGDLFKQARQKRIAIICVADTEETNGIIIVEDPALPFVRIREAVAEHFDILFCPGMADYSYRALFPHRWRGLRAAFCGQDFVLERAGQSLTFSVTREELDRVTIVAEWTKARFPTWAVRVVVKP